MKNLIKLLILPFTLSGCSGDMNGHIVNNSSKFCAKHGGVSNVKCRLDGCNTTCSDGMVLEHIEKYQENENN
jgi:putative hemolysin